MNHENPVSILTPSDIALIKQLSEDGYTDEQLQDHLLDKRAQEWKQAIKDVAAGRILEAVKEVRRAS